MGRVKELFERLSAQQDQPRPLDKKIRTYARAANDVRRHANIRATWSEPRNGQVYCYAEVQCDHCDQWHMLASRRVDASSYVDLNERVLIEQGLISDFGGAL
jgi:hypothetical protein